MYDCEREQLERGYGLTIDSAEEIEEIGQSTPAMNDVFKQVYDDAHDGTQPRQRVQFGRVIGTVVRDSAPNCEQELAVRVDVLLPDAETVKSYKALYGRRHPDEVIDRLFRLHVSESEEGNLNALIGVEVPLAYVDGQWHLYLVSTGGIFDRLRLWVLNKTRVRPDADLLVEFGKSYQTPFPEGDVIETRELLDA